ncbi:MAG: hypothetical protein ACR2PZ_19340 [Pseudomonadales bacterium]
MEHQDYLLTFAEVAAAFAGFSAIVTSFVQSRGSTVLRINHYRTRVMIEYSLCVVVFAFVPYLIFVVTESEDASWRVASGLLALVWTLIAVSSGRRARVVLGDSGFSVAPGFSYTMAGLTIVGTLILWANVIGFRVGTAGGFFLLGISFPLLQSALYFLHIVTHSAPDETEPG